MPTGRIPLGFTAASFADLRTDLGLLVERAGLGTGQVVVQMTGAACSYLSPGPYQPADHTFDARGAGTTDIQLEAHLPQVADWLEERGAPFDPFALDIDLAGGFADHRFYDNRASGEGFLDLFPAVAELCSAWAQRLGRAGGFHVSLLVAEAPPSRGVLGEPIELLRRTGSGRFQPPGNPGGAPHRIRHPLPLDLDASALQERLAAAGDVMQLRDHDHWGPYLRRSDGLRMIRTGGTWHIEVVAPGAAAATAIQRRMVARLAAALAL